MQADDVPFWRRKTLDQMTHEEWESLCDGCGRCCLVKLEDEDTGAIYLTSVSCSLLDAGTCRCKSYETRFLEMHDCVSVTLATVRSVDWLPDTCAYRLLNEGQELQWWHPLVSGDPNTVRQAGISVGPWVTSESKVATSELDQYIIDGFAPELEF